MARIRTVKPEIYQDEDLAAVSESAFILAIGLLNHSDDFGYFKANPGLIRSVVFPLREPSVNIQCMLIELSKIEYIELFKGIDGKEYGVVRNFLKHQRVNRPSPSKIEPLRGFSEDSVSDHGGLTAGKERNREQGKEQGTGKGKELSPPAQSIPFGIFWNRYPRKTNKQKAEAAWKKLNPSEDLLNEIIQNIDRRLLLDEWSRDRKDFIPHASTFLNGRRWEDEVVPKTGGSNGYQQPSQPSDRPRSGADRLRAIVAQQECDASLVGEDAGDLRPQVGRVVRDDAQPRLDLNPQGDIT